MVNATQEPASPEEPGKAKRDERLSPDGKWRSYPKVPCLLQYVSTGEYYGRAKIHGKVIRRKLQTTVFTTAKLRLRDFLTQERGRKPRNADTPLTFLDARYLYEADLDADHAINDTTKRYRRFCLKALAKTWPELDGLKLWRITPTACKEWAKRFAERFDAVYFNNTLGTLRAILERGGLGKNNPATEVKRLGVKRTRLQLPSRDQFNRILHIIETSGAGQAQHCADLVRFLAFSGCRLSEARNVTWEDANWHAGTLTVKNAKLRRSLDADETRTVPMIPDMTTLLERLRAASSDAPLPGTPVCAVHECEKSLTRACAVVGIPKLTHHDLRHLFATRCIESGVDIQTVSRWLGHRDGGALAMKTYGHLRQEHSLQMAKKVRF